MAFLTPLTLEQFEDLGLEAYNAEAATPANTGPGSTMGAIENAAASAAMQLQQQVLYLASISRLATIPPLPSGLPNPDLDAFCLAFDVQRLGANAAGDPFTFETSSPVSGGPLVVPVGGIAQTAGGLQFLVVEDDSNEDYNAADNGYPIANGDDSVTVTMVCLTDGSIGNLPANTQLTPYGPSSGPPIIGIASIFNPSALTNGVDGESDSAYKTRFTIEVSSGRVATQNAIVGAILEVQTGIIVSFGNRVNLDLSQHNSYYSVVVNEANTGTGPSSAFLSACEAAAASVTAAGTSFQVVGPTLIAVNVGVQITLKSGYSITTVGPAVQAALTSFLNGVGMAADTSSVSVGQYTLGAVVLGTPGVATIVGELTLNSAESDVVAAFGNQIIAGSISVTT